MTEFHGNCDYEDIDYSDWQVGDLIKCDMGFYTEVSKKDWFKIEGTYYGQDEPQPLIWSCEDGVDTGSYKKDTTQNCKVNPDKSQVSFPKDGKATFNSHWMRHLDTEDEDDDIVIVYDGALKADYNLELPNGIYGKASSVDLCISMKDCNDDDDDDNANGLAL